MTGVAILFPIASSLALLWILITLWRRRKLYIYSWNIPGPPSFPLIGSAHMFLGNTNDTMAAVVNFQKSYPGLSKLWLGPKLLYSVSEPKHIEKILTTAMNKNEFYEFISFAIGEGLMTANSEKWRKHKKGIMPAFNQKVLDNFVEIYAEQAEILSDQLKKYVNQKNFDLFLLLSRCTLDIICETGMGIKMHIQTSNSEFGKIIDRMMEITTYRVFRIWHHLRCTWQFYPMSKEYAALIDKFRKVTSSVVRRKVEEFEEKKRLEEDSVDIDDGPRNRKIAFLDLIVQNSDFTEEELRDEVEIFMIAGSDTTASEMSCIFAILGMFQDIQQKVLDEILDIMGPDRAVLPTDLPQMKYLDMVIKESLRIFPVACFFLREIQEDLDLGDAILPEGCSTFFGPVHIHRNPKYWPDPLKFDPHRFLPENVAKRHPCTYIPFSYGPRSCIGGRFAVMNMKTIIATVLRKFKIFSEYKSIEEMEIKSNIIMRLKDGPKVWIEPR